jgi:hypothetical protein
MTRMVESSGSAQPSVSVTEMVRRWRLIRLTHSVLFLLPFLSFASCRSVVFHSWQVPGDDRQVTINTSRWPVVSKRLYVAVPEDKIEVAAEFLESHESVRLSSEQESLFVENFERPVDNRLKAYLVRGLTMGRPTFSVLRRNSTTNELVVFRAKWNGETSFPFSEHVFGVWPIVIYLEEPPRRVYCTAVFGGDRIMHGRGSEIDRRVRNRDR